jgi:high-affinity nickel-transport protein
VSPSPARPRWSRADRRGAAGILGAVLTLHVVAIGVLVWLVLPHHYQLGSQVFGLGLGVTAYVYGMRHAFDADHIAAIDNTTRKLMADGSRPKGVGFWFALGHSGMVFVLAALVAGGTKAVTTLTSDGSTAHRALSLVGTSVSGGFLYVIAALNVISLIGILRVFRGLRGGGLDEARFEDLLAARGLLARVLGRLTRAITRQEQMVVVGMLFGLGFDTASEVALLVLAGSGAATGLPWYAVLVLPLLFAAGMSLLDSLDGLFMGVAYDWAFAQPVRKVYYNLCVTGLSVAVALLIGTIELVTVVHDNAGLRNPVTDWVAGISLNNVGFVVVGVFVAVWAAAIGYWRLARVEERWAARSAPAGSP